MKSLLSYLRYRHKLNNAQFAFNANLFGADLQK